MPISGWPISLKQISLKQISLKPSSSVLIAHSQGDFNRKLDEALKLHADPEYRAALERTASENTWDIRAKTILEALAGRKESG